MRKIALVLNILALASACGDAPSKEKKPLIINNSNNVVNNTSTNNMTTNACCAGLQCGGSSTCADVVCGVCDETALCNDAQQCEPLPADGPRILDLSINTTTATPNTTLIVSAIVTDPDGVADLIGGSLKSPTGATYGSFQTSAAEGSYQLIVTWDQLNSVQAILFDAPITRDVVAEFYDQAGHKVQRSLTLTLACDSASAAACSAGSCVDLNTSSAHCGSCNNALDEQVYCSGGQPTCSSGDFCPQSGVCSGNSAQACGGCDNNCETKAAGLFDLSDPDSGLYCAEPSEKLCEAYVISKVAKSCDLICGAAQCYTSSASFAESGVSADCATDWSEPRWVQDYGPFTQVSCSCLF